VIATVTAGILGAAGIIEVGGLPAILILLAPVAVLLIVIARLSRRPKTPRPAPQAGPETPGAVPAEAAAAPAPVAAPRTEPPPVGWAVRIRSAAEENDQATLAQLCLSAAHAEISEGHSDAAAEYLREAVRAAARSRTAPVEAEARLALAELARAAGDLTTACEHWQLARALFHDLDETARRDETETLMRNHGCPTDWVLNDF
jgi:hypothetical protein